MAVALTLKERCIRRVTGLKALRQPYEEEWREIARYAQPSRSRFLNSEQNRNFKRSNKAIYNSHGILSFRTLTGGMTSGLSSPSRPWFRLTPYDQDLAGDSAAKAWLAEVERRMYAFLSGTNFYAAVKGGYAEMGMFGTEACVMVDHPDRGAVCHALTAGEYWIGLSNASVADTLYRRVPMTVHQAVQNFGDKVSARVRTLYDSARYDQQVQVMHGIEPNDEQVPGLMTAAGKPWRSVYWDEQDSGKEAMLRVEGFDEQPFWAPRWDTIGGDTYGTSPGFDSLPDMRELQLQTRRKTQATARLVNPEKIVPASVKLTGEAGNVVSASQVDASHVIVPYEVPHQAIQAIMGDVERCAEAVDRLTYADLFMAITNMQGIQPRNIEEIASRNEEKLTQLGPVIERVNSEKLEVAIDRTFAIMSRKRMFPPAPEQLQGAPVKVDFVSILAQMQRMVGLGQIERTVSFIGNLAAQFPEAGDRLDIDATVDDYADRAGAPPKIIRSLKDAQGMRDQRAHDQQMAKMAAMAPAAQQGADAARLMSEAAQNGGGIGPLAGLAAPA
ncbi:portal protein [Sphingomonas sp. AR_OL41]|uniref:portal protein n=1 Tax=Sphingomonas sp. AR_OL41 TaxID=3042729 RepID=UPI002480B22C|nr:portal protein [Sphingomonas sp. AR_OL41]MDH7973694.1 portal protein [Sphingomonas sp. AR_OL41]